MPWTSNRRVRDLEDRVADLTIQGQGMASRLDSLSAALGELERPVRELETEWLDSYEKFRNLYGRITKRMERDAKEETAAEPADINPLAKRLLERGA